MDTATPSISVTSLRRLLGTPSAPVILDVRRSAAYEADPVGLPAAMRRDPDAVAQWGPTLAVDRPLVVYCVHGHEVSQNAANALLGLGIEASYLEGGIETWKHGGAPTLTRQRAPEFQAPPTRWVTRERPKIDRIACPWLIRRFIDPAAAFLYVPAGEVADVARAQSAIPYDVPDVQFSHRGEHCSFDAVLEDFGLHDAALDALATIVRGADTGRPELSPQSPGLLAISLGLSANYADDHAMLEQGMVVYDALYAWLSRAHGEIHNAKLFEKT
jgi:rhodanese-related sulfurtransferase